MQSNLTNNTIRNLLAGITVAMVIIPEVIASAIVIGIPPIIALHTAVIIGLITSVFGGRSGMISSTTAATALVAGLLVSQYGIEYLFSTVIITGIIQILFGLLAPKKLIKNIISDTTFKVFLIIVAGMIFFGQIKQFKINGEWIVNDKLLIMLLIISTTILIIHYFPKITRSIPSIFVAIVASSVAVLVFNIDTNTIGDIASLSGGLPLFHIPDVDFLNLSLIVTILPFSISIAIIGIFHSLIIIKLIDNFSDRIYTHEEAKPNKECIVQGAANTISGLFSGSGGCGMIGQSIVNIKSGTGSRASGIISSITLLIFILFLSKYIELIPIAALIGVMFTIIGDTLKLALGRMN
jgi:SulP family sulfate permease